MIYEYLLINKDGSCESYESSQIVNDILKVRVGATKLSSNYSAANTGGVPNDRYYKVTTLNNEGMTYLIGISNDIEIDEKEIIPLLFTYNIRPIQEK
ncbi:Uncharacterised protein [Providencia rustigianii]|uniref:Uncharacterized protein n=1 Tax=Providencia rustigianii TaxID=158850 RepID=A0A379G5T7_9GAMM|nr:hypothetical protein [Providencia rustigianii]SUC36251.1 Uncharacterised protein [Providencia rustigianii]